MNIGTLDLSILVLYLLAMVAFGMFMGRGSKSSADFMVGGRNLPWYAVLFSIVATETSTVTFLSVPGIAYFGDLRFLQLPLGYIVGRLIVCVILLPRYFRGEMFTAYEVLDKRFGGGVKRAASGLFIVTRTLGDGLRLYLGAIVLKEVAGVDMNSAIVILGVATIIYTFVGGIRAVVWTDFIQFVVYMVGAGVALWILLGGLEGGWSAVEAAAAPVGPDGVDKLRVFDWGFDVTVSYQFWVGLIGGAVFAVGTHGVDQLMVQRYLCARSQKQAALALGLSGPLVFLQFAFFLVIGTALYAYYLAHPPATAFDPAAPDRVFAQFIVDEIPPGVLGIVLGALFSAAMSTLSSSLNSSATVLVNDILKLNTDAARLRFAKLLTIGFGILQIAVGIGGQFVPGAVVGSVLAIQSFTTGIILGVFLLGIATKRLGSEAALTGLAVGLVFMTWVKFGEPWLGFGPLQLLGQETGSIAWPWFALVGSTATFGFGIAAHALHSRRGRAIVVGLATAVLVPAVVAALTPLTWLLVVVIGSTAGVASGILAFRFLSPPRS